MLTLCGFNLSNYYNKAKLILLEKGIAFEERVVRPGQLDASEMSASPLGKVPFLLTPQGPLCESEVIAEYLEALQPEPRLMPTDPYAAAKVRELITFVELHLELVARELYGAAYFGGTVSDANKARVEKLLVRNIQAFKSLARFAPYLAGDSFTRADCAAYVSLPLVGMTTRITYGHDLLLDAGIDWKAYAKLIEQRPSAQRVAADRKKDQL